MAQTNDLGKVMQEVLENRTPKQLSPEQVHRIKIEFGRAVAGEAERIRSEKRRTYEDIKSIALM